jgi:hypothetical protein
MKEKLPKLKGTTGAIKLAAEIRTKALKSGKFEPMYLNLIRRINDADWWIVNRYDLTLGRFKHPAPRHLEQIHQKRNFWFWFIKIWRKFFSNKTKPEIKIKANSKIEPNLAPKPIAVLPVTVTPIKLKPTESEQVKSHRLRDEENWRAM